MQSLPNNAALLQEAFDHLLRGRFRLALPLAKQLTEQMPESADAALCYAWACAENGNAATATQYLERSRQKPIQSTLTQMYRGYVQMRLSSFEGAIYDFNMTEGRQKELLAWTYLNKAKSLACIGEPERANSFFDLALMIDHNANPSWKLLRKYFSSLRKLQQPELPGDLIIQLAREAWDHKEYWYSLLACKALLQHGFEGNPDIRLLLLESMYRMNQLSALTEQLDASEALLQGNPRFRALRQLASEAHVRGTNMPGAVTAQGQDSESPLQLHENPFAEAAEVIVFNADADPENTGKQNLVQINFSEKPTIGVQLLLKNLHFRKQDVTQECFFAWFIDDELVAQTACSSSIPADWEMYQLPDSVMTRNNPLWTFGTARLEFYINRNKVFTRTLLLGNADLAVMHADPEQPEGPRTVTITEVFAELDRITGLSSVKESVRSLYNYLLVLQERRALGLKADQRVSVHATFLGNPGTGKTTVARLMGKIFKGMGLLSTGEVIEVDRASLVGQYVGETAQKTEQVITSALGNVLFIDEAYTLVKAGQSNDFGKEAIDILLKRMEDHKGEFFVIAAGYPEEMNGFLEANPGLRSRFTHHFTFEDYTPDEMLAIYISMATDEQYRMEENAGKYLLKEFNRMYRSRDKNFGNARTVRKVFDDTTMHISQRYLQLALHERTIEKLTTITEDILRAVFADKDSKKNYQVPVQEEQLQAALEALQRLTGLHAVKRDVQELVKLAKFYRHQGEDPGSKLASHIIFVGNPGTGKTTVARLLSSIYAALGILPGGQLVETDRQGLVAAHVGATAQKASGIITKAMGGTLFIDEAYTLVTGGGDFGQEAIDVLLKRMEDDRGKFIVIAAGYTEEMQRFLESNPGLKSRFTRTFTFEDYSPDECMDILHEMGKGAGTSFSEEANQALHRYFNDAYRNRDKNYGNARMVRNTFDKVFRAMNLRLSDTTARAGDGPVQRVITLEDARVVEPVTNSVAVTVRGDAIKLSSLLSELNALTGLRSVKENIEKLVNSLKIAALRRERGMQVIQKPLHSVFLGNPGTGKTTVARLLSALYRELGLLEQGQLIEVDRAQLVAGYSGQTAIKTDDVIRKAIGGTLFIDEAYTLARGGNDFGQEAIDTLLKRMEDYKGSFIVIAAGYTKEMQQFLESNPGLTSRFTNIFTFEDYLPDELTQIAAGMAKHNGYQFTESGHTALGKAFQRIYEERDGNFGNARTARNFLMEIITHQEARITGVLKPTDDELMLLTEQDIFA